MKRKTDKKNVLLAPAGADDYTQQVWETAATRTFARVDEPEAPLCVNLG